MIIRSSKKIGHAFKIATTVYLLVCIPSLASTCPDVKGTYVGGGEYSVKRVDAWIIPIKNPGSINFAKTLRNLVSNGYADKNKPRVTCDYQRVTAQTERLSCINNIANQSFWFDPTLVKEVPNSTGGLVRVFEKNWYSPTSTDMSEDLSFVSCKQQTFFKYRLQGLGAWEVPEPNTLPNILFLREMRQIDVKGSTGLPSL